MKAAMKLSATHVSRDIAIVREVAEFAEKGIGIYRPTAHHVEIALYCRIDVFSAGRPEHSGIAQG